MSQLVLFVFIHNASELPSRQKVRKGDVAPSVRIVVHPIPGCRADPVMMLLQLTLYFDSELHFRVETVQYSTG